MSKLKNNKFKMSNLLKKRSTNSNSRFRNISNHTKEEIMKDLSLGMLSHSEIMAKYNISQNELRQIDNLNKSQKINNNDANNKASDSYSLNIPSHILKKIFEDIFSGKLSHSKIMTKYNITKEELQCLINFKPNTTDSPLIHDPFNIVSSIYPDSAECIVNIPINNNKNSIPSTPVESKKKQPQSIQQIQIPTESENHDISIDITQFDSDSIINVARFTHDNRINKKEPKISKDNIITIDNESIQTININNNKKIKSSENKNDDTSVHHIKRPRLTEDKINAIINDIKLERYNYRELAERNNVSISTIYKLKNKFKLINDETQPQNDIILTNNDKLSDNITSLEDEKLVILPIDSDHAEDETNKIFYNENILSSRIKIINDIKIGMIRNRHNMPIDQYIFDIVDQKLLDDFNAQYEIAYERIKKLFDENPNKDKVLSLYVTGLASVLGAIIKACNDLNINLILLHWNPKKMKYFPQNIFVEKEIKDSNNINICPLELSKISCRHLYTYKCSAYDFIDQGWGFEIIEYLNEDITADLDNDDTIKDITLFTNKKDAWEYYIALCDNAPTKTNIVFNKVYITKSTHTCNRLYVQETISKRRNYRF